MTEHNLDQLLSGTVEAVLETMFFCSTLGPAEAETADTVVEARLAFHGHPSGTLGVRLSQASARGLAAGFLGEDEATLTDWQPALMVCELANMVCGSLVSMLEGEESFDLTSPELVPFEIKPAVVSEPAPAARQSFALDNGILTVTLHLEPDA
jgi:CheY-specific phosphatase CheX